MAAGNASFFWIRFARSAEHFDSMGGPAFFDFLLAWNRLRNLVVGLVNQSIGMKDCRTWERAAIDCLASGVEQLHTEVFRRRSLDEAVGRGDQFFSVMASVRVVSEAD